MNLINAVLGVPLGYIMWGCYALVKNYGLAIILFTLQSKFILFPVSLIVQRNSIKMVKLKPQLEEASQRYAGDKDRIAEEQIKLYDAEHYSPALGCLPLFLQMICLNRGISA
jgi:YidC/Oxa1 family membrane protein insertase